MQNHNYIFTSKRLGFRNWKSEDFQALHTINTDTESMRFFPSISTEAETRAFILRMQEHQAQYGFCYFAVEVIDSGEFIGFIGLCHQQFKSPFTPTQDIGWRLDKRHWNNGYATEGALRCIEYGFQECSLDQIRSFAPIVNQPSIHVMEKIGMQKIGEFKHPALTEHQHLEMCVCYEIKR